MRKDVKKDKRERLDSFRLVIVNYLCFLGDIIPHSVSRVDLCGKPYPEVGGRDISF